MGGEHDTASKMSWLNSNEFENRVKRSDNIIIFKIIQNKGENMDATEKALMTGSDNQISDEVPVGQRFNYGQLSEEVVEQVRESEKMIQDAIGQVQDSIFVIGDQLLIMKDILGHNYFTPWMEQSLGFSKRTGQRYMAVAQMIDSQKRHAVVFENTTLYELAKKSTPEEIVKKAIDVAESGSTVSLDLVKKWKNAAPKSTNEIEPENKTVLKEPIKGLFSEPDAFKSNVPTEKEGTIEVIPETEPENKAVLKEPTWSPFLDLEESKSNVFKEMEKITEDVPVTEPGFVLDYFRPIINHLKEQTDCDGNILEKYFNIPSDRFDSLIHRDSTIGDGASMNSPFDTTDNIKGESSPFG
jgi:hypothetical protein